MPYIEISGISQRYHTLEGVFFKVFISRQNKYYIKVFVPCRVGTKKLINIKVRKLKSFALKCTLLGQNRLNHTKFISCAREKAKLEQ